MATRSFAADIGRFVDETKVSADLVVRRLALEMHAGLLKRSPVDTGRFRGNWRIGVAQRDTTVDEGGPSLGTKTGQPANAGEAAAAVQSLAGVKYGQTVHISNSLPYAKPLNDGHSKQVGKRFMERTFLDVLRNFSRVVAEVKKANKA